MVNYGRKLSFPFSATDRKFRFVGPLFFFLASLCDILETKIPVLRKRATLRSRCCLSKANASRRKEKKKRGTLRRRCRPVNGVQLRIRGGKCRARIERKETGPG